jgi:hypothetical protein
MTIHTISQQNAGQSVMQVRTGSFSTSVGDGGGGNGANYQMIIWPTDTPPPDCTYVEYVEVAGVMITGAFDCTVMVAFASPTGAELTVAGTATPATGWTLTDVGASNAWVYTGSKLGPSTTPTTLRLIPTDPVGNELLAISVGINAEAGDTTDIPSSVQFDSITWSWI